MTSAGEAIAVYLVTHRRNETLRRAVTSVQKQTHRNLVVNVVNDAPDDLEVERIVEAAADPRVRLHQPVKKRGATLNFNLAFREQEAPFSAILEDDNWWEPTFLESQLQVLKRYPGAPLVVGNERMWTELPDGTWHDHGTTIWTFRDVRYHEITLESLCGGARLCNSSMLVRTEGARRLLLPEFVPVDVTEHYRERLLPRRYPLNGEPLVNFSRTINSARSNAGLWELHQIALIGSVFKALPDRATRRKLARSLWRMIGVGESPRATALIGAGLAIREARTLVESAPLSALRRAAVGYLRRPARLGVLKKARRGMNREFSFLTNTDLMKELVQAYDEGSGAAPSGCK